MLIPYSIPQEYEINVVYVLYRTSYIIFYTYFKRNSHFYW